MTPSCQAARPLAVLTTGGTFEKVYRPTEGRLWFDQSGLEDWKRQCRLPEPSRLEVVMLVDSLDMTEAERDHLAQRIAQAPEARVVVIHGTDTMVVSALRAAAAQRPDQVVVFTGAMVPASQSSSDALFNLGMAVAASQLLDPGSYICMSGQVFPSDQAVKNKAAGRFELLPNAEAAEDRA
ncbi:MAG: asparaginase [Betaproteobacteria bacterium]|nr:asparaginase [Betaproteobacteria bacterium]